MVNINPTDLNSLINQRANQSSSFASNPTDLNSQISQNASFSTLHSNEIRSQLNSNHANNSTNYANLIHRPNQSSSQHLSQLISSIRRITRSYNQVNRQINQLNGEFGNTARSLHSMQRMFRSAHYNTERYSSLMHSLGNEVISIRRGLHSGAAAKRYNASDIQRQVRGVQASRSVLNQAHADTTKPPSNSYGRQLGRDLNATVPAMTLASFIDHNLNNSRDSNTSRGRRRIIGQSVLDYQRYHLTNPLRGLTNSMTSVLRPYRNANSRGYINNRTYTSAENNFNHYFGNRGIYPQIEHILQNHLSSNEPHFANLAHRQLSSMGLDNSSVNDDGFIDRNTRLGRNTYNAVLDQANGNGKHSRTAAAYLNNYQEISRVRHSLATLGVAIDSVRNALDKYHDKMSNNAFSLHDHSKITKTPSPGSVHSLLFGATKTLMDSAFPALFAQIKANNDSGNQLREDMGPQIYSQVLGNSINGGNTPYEEDDTLERRMGHRATQYGENMEQMTQNLQSLSGTRDTNYNDMTNAAMNEGRFERANNVNPQVAQQLFGTLGQAGGLGSRGNQVNSNLSSLSAQFAGMLNRDHLGAMGTQQAQGLSSIFGSMLNSGQSITPHTAGNVMAMQSVLSQGSGGQVFQGQQGAQQLTAFSHGVGGAFNNQLIRNAFAGGMPQYGGQQGLYRLQMDMQEPLKHPTQLNNMIQGMSHIAGPAGAEDALTQMGLGPSAAKQIYRKAMTGQLTEGNLKRVQRKNRNRGRTTQDRALRTYNRMGTSTIDKLRSIRENVRAIASMMWDGTRRDTNAVEGPMSTTNSGSLLDTGMHLIGNAIQMPFSLGGSMLLSHLVSNFLGGRGNLLKTMAHLGGGEFHPIVHPSRTWQALKRSYPEVLNRGKAYARGFKNNGISGIQDAYDAIYNTDNNSRLARDIRPTRSLAASHLNLVRRLRSHIPSVIRNHIPYVNGPLASRARRGLEHIPRVGKYVSRAGSALARHPQALKLGKGAGHLAGRALDYAAPISGIWTAGHYLRRGRPLRALSGGIDSTLSNSDIGLGADIIGGGAKMLGMHTLGNGIEKLGNSPLHSLGKLLGFDRTANASTRKGAQGSSEAHTHTRHSVYYWLRRINRLLPALAKKMSGFSDVDPSLAGNTSSYAASKMNNGDTNPNKQSTTKPGTSTTPNGPSSNSGAKSYNGTGNSGVNAKDTAATIEPAQVSSNYFDATLGTTNNTDDHSRHEDSHNVYKNYINAPSQNFLSKLMENSQKAQAYFGHTHQTEWG